MAVTNPEAIKFCNDVVRPLAEQFRAIKAQLASLNVQWSLKTGLFPADSQVIEDGRDVVGDTRLTGQDVQDLLYAITAIIKPAIDGIPAATIEKPCVRTFQAT